MVIPAAAGKSPEALERLTGSAGGPSLLRAAVETARCLAGVANVVVATDAAEAVNAAAGLATAWYQPHDDSWCGVVRASRALDMLPPTYSATVDVIVIWEPEEASLTAGDLALLVNSVGLISRESSRCAICLTAPALPRDWNPRRRAVLLRETARGDLDFWPRRADGPVCRALSVYGFTPAGLRRAAAATPTVDAIAARAEQLAWVEAGMEIAELRLPDARPAVRTRGDMRRWLKRNEGW